ncbi:MAG: hypothetical protein L0154_08015 [Chloroflexi bacterium]|nr:hypothetical protein [Chloroflexota bacterium]
MSDAAQTLNQAFQLIEQGELAAAREFLNKVRPQNENNPDFWWVYAHAVESPAEGQQALQRVQTLRPDYPGLNAVSQQAGLTTTAPVKSLRPAGGPPPVPELPRDDFGDFDDTDFEATPEGGNRRRNIILVLLVLLIVVVVGVLVLPGLLSSQPTPTEIVFQPLSPVPVTQVTAEAVDGTEPVAATEDIEPTATEEISLTDEATETEQIVATDDSEPSEEVTPTAEESDNFAALAAALSQFDVPPNGIALEATELGNTLLVATCAPAGPAATASILNIVATLQEETLGEDIEAFGFRITNCSDETIVRVVAVTRQQFDDFADGTLDRQQFLAVLRPIG